MPMHRSYKIDRTSLKDIILNPFYLYALSFSGAMVLFFLGWIDYPNLTPPLFLFIGSSIVVSFILGYVISIKKKAEDLYMFDSFRIWNVSVITVIMISIGILITLLYAGKIPLFEILFSNENYDFQRDFYPIKYLTVLLTSLNSAMITLLVYLSCRFKQKKYFMLSMINWIIVLLFGSRGLFMVTFLPILFIGLHSLKFTRIRVLSLMAFFIAGVYLFGIYGDIREGAKSRNEYSLYEQMSSDNYPDWVPEKFIWFYMYYSSPIAKFQYVVDDPTVNAYKNDYKMLFFREMIPYSIGKILYPQSNISERSSDYGYPDHFVGTAYDDAYLFAKWKGVYVYSGFLFAFLFLTVLFVRKYFRFLFVPICAVISVIGFYSVFDNMLYFSPVMFMLYWLILIAFLLKRFKVVYE